MEKPTIIELPTRTLVGMRRDMSFAQNLTRELWTDFRHRDSAVQHRVGEGYFSVQNYPEMTQLTPQTTFSKWACVEVSEVGDVPVGMEVVTLGGGLWAKFVYQGTVTGFRVMWHWMFDDWLPSSSYRLDDRHHYEYLDHRWLGPHNELSEEDIFLPVMEKE